MAAGYPQEVSAGLGGRALHVAAGHKRIVFSAHDEHGHVDRLGLTGGDHRVLSPRRLASDPAGIDGRLLRVQAAEQVLCA